MLFYFLLLLVILSLMLSVIVVFGDKAFFVWASLWCRKILKTIHSLHKDHLSRKKYSLKSLGLKPKLHLLFNLDSLLFLITLFFIPSHGVRCSVFDGVQMYLNHNVF